MTATKMLRQGDVLLVRMEALPEGVVRVGRRGRIVLAEGEATGHAHVVASRDAVVHVDPRADERFLLVRGKRPVVLRHEEHDPIAVLTRGLAGQAPARVRPSKGTMDRGLTNARDLAERVLGYTGGAGAPEVDAAAGAIVGALEELGRVVTSVHTTRSPGEFAAASSSLAQAGNPKLSPGLAGAFRAWPTAEARRRHDPTWEPLLRARRAGSTSHAA